MPSGFVWWGIYVYWCYWFWWTVVKIGFVVLKMEYCSGVCADLTFWWAWGFDFVSSLGVSNLTCNPNHERWLNWPFLGSWFWYAEELGIWKFGWSPFKFEMIWQGLLRLICMGFCWRAVPKASFKRWVKFQ